MRVLIVEDQRKVASFLARALRENAYAVDIADTGEKALALALENAYDLILLDIRLPGLSGIEVCRRLRMENVHTPILMLTARSLVEQRVEGLDAGADDYLAKPFALTELMARVRALIRRGFNKSAAILQFEDLELDRHRRRAKRAGTEIQLTAKEFALLEFLLVRAPDAVTRSEIVEHVWDCHFDSESNLVDVYINRLRQKVDHSHVIKLIYTLRGTGYRLGASK